MRGTLRGMRGMRGIVRAMRGMRGIVRAMQKYEQMKLYL